MEYSSKKPLLIYFITWSLSIAAYWINYNSFYYSFVIVPIITLGVAFAIGLGGCSIVKGFVTAFWIGVTYMFENYFTLSLSNMLFNRYSSFRLPYPEYILFGGVIFLFGFFIGKVCRLFKRV